MRTLIVLIWTIAFLVVGCEPVERDWGDAAEQVVTYPHPPAVIGEPAPSPMPAALRPEHYTCADACTLASVGACLDLEDLCGLDCGIVAPLDLTIDDGCDLYGLEFVATPHQVGEDCAPALWTRAAGVCGGAWAGYCCTVDGSPIGE